MSTASIARAPRPHRRSAASTPKQQPPKRSTKAEPAPSSGRFETTVIYVLLTLGVAFFGGLFWMIAGASATP